MPFKNILKHFFIEQKVSLPVSTTILILWVLENQNKNNVLISILVKKIEEYLQRCKRNETNLFKLLEVKVFKC